MIIRFNGNKEVLEYYHCKRCDNEGLVNKFSTEYELQPKKHSEAKIIVEIITCSKCGSFIKEKCKNHPPNLFNL